jgi:hypothetical protein
MAEITSIVQHITTATISSIPYATGEKPSAGCPIFDKITAADFAANSSMLL